jgi:hypothetical protein
VEKLGSDRVLARGPRVIVLSRADMPDWEVRSFRRATVRFRGEDYFVAVKERHPEGGFRYVLERWPDGSSEIGGAVIDYDEGYVTARDGERRARVAARGVQTALAPFSPLIGFLPDAVKRRLADRYGISEQRATEQSLWLEAMLVLACGALLSIEKFGGVYGSAFGVGEIPWLAGASATATVALVLMAPDLVVRYARILGESERSYGFWEWLFRREP